MATKTARQPGSQKHQGISRILKTLDKKTKPFQAFWAKFNNDWSWNNAAGLAFNLILSIFPLVIALLALIGFFVGRLDPVAYHDLTTRKLHDLFPAVTSSQNIIQPALRQLTKDSGILGIFAIIVSIFNGSRLFMFLQGCFDLIYHVRPRNVIVQNALSVVMVLLFVILVPIMVAAGSAVDYARTAKMRSVLQSSTDAAAPETRSHHQPPPDRLRSPTALAACALRLLGQYPHPVRVRALHPWSRSAGIARGATLE